MKILKKLCGFYEAGEILQLYIHDETVNTHIGFTNFYSYFKPEQNIKIQCLVSVRDASGKPLHEKKINLAQFASLGVNLKYLFPDLVSQYGIVSIKPIIDRKLYYDVIKSKGYFYVLYTDKKGSVGIVHPQSQVGDKESSFDWQSHAVINLEPVDKVRLYLINPALQKPFHTKVALVDKQKQIFNQRDIALNPLATQRVDFNTQSLTCRFASISSDHLIGNSKPLVFWYYPDDTFGMMHS